MSVLDEFDFSTLPAPQVVEVPDFETVLALVKADLVTEYPEAADALESDAEPLAKWAQRLAYQIVNERSARNDSALAVMLAYAQGGDLDQIAAGFGVPPRLVITPADPEAVPPVAAVYEGDHPFRQRVRLAAANHGAAGTFGSYVEQALSAHGQVLDAYPSSPEPGIVNVVVLVHAGNGTPGADVLEAVQTALEADEVRLIGEQVTAVAVTVVNYSIEAVIYKNGKPESADAVERATEAAQQVVAELRRIKKKIPISRIYAALQNVAGVASVDLMTPEDDVAIGETEAGYCTGIVIADGGILV
ncbi:baseplate J/gp47 family protein [Leptospira sp. 96542]|nr:baseplate J/gp47 family protein [Leptospira sp. 96542]